MDEKINEKFKKINQELPERKDLVDLFIESRKKSSQDNKKIKEFLGVKIKEVFNVDYGEFTISLLSEEICITMWKHLNKEDIKKFDNIMGKQSKIICEDEFIHLKYEFNKYH